MISLSEAIEIFIKDHKDRVVTKAFEYDNGRYFMLVGLFHGKKDANSPYYLIDRKNGHIYSTTPTRNLKLFNDALKNHEIYTKQV